jgi:ubiquinone/menaquinone biosynthesis C-methylase UbiE
MLNHLHNHLHGQKGAGQPSGSMQGWGKTYDLMVRIMTFGQEQKLRLATVVQAKIRPGERILEVGCGTGSVSLAAKREAGTESQVFGIDIAPDMVAIARQKAGKAGLDVQFQEGRIEAIPFPDEQFDLVLSSLMLHHVIGAEAKQKGIQEIYRVLKPGGRLLVVDAAQPKNPLLRGMANLVVGHEMLAHGMDEYIPMLEQAGYVNIETGPTSTSFLAYLSGGKPS